MTRIGVDEDITIPFVPFPEVILSLSGLGPSPLLGVALPVEDPGWLLKLDHVPTSISFSLSS